MRFWTALGASLLLWIGHGVGSAQTAADKAIADTMFAEGQKLIAAGKTEAACAKFEASLAKLTQLGAQLALASCYEKLGKTASAWGAFRAAASLARRAHDARQAFADQHASALEAKLSKLTIKIEPGYRIDGLAVKRDGVDVMPAELGSPIPVNPGDHTVEASAPGWVAWSTKVTVTPTTDVIEVIVPALGKAPVKVEEPRPSPAPAVPAIAAPASDLNGARRNRRLLAYGVGGGGVAFLGASLTAGAMASSRWSDAQAHCSGTLCDQRGVDLASGARTMGNISTATFVVGAAALATGVYLLLTAPSGAGERPPAVAPDAWRVVPDGGASPLGLAIQGGF